MFTKIKNWLSTNNHLLWVSIIALIVIGLMGTYFVGPYEVARTTLGSFVGPHFFFNKFWPYALVGAIVLFVLSKLSKKAVVRISWVLGIMAFLLIICSIIFPVYIAGATRHAFFAGWRIDPYAMMLPPYIVLMSHWLSKERKKQVWITIWTTLLTLFIMCAAFLAPYMFMVLVYLLLFIIIGFKARKNAPGIFYTGIGILIVLASITLLAIFGLPHVQYRLLALVHETNYATQMSVHAITSSTLIGSTTESLATLSVLPQSVKDFAFTSMIAKFGILVGVLILALYGCIVKGLTNIVRNTKDQFNKLLSTGILGMFVIYTVMALIVAFGILATAAYWPFIRFGTDMMLSWCILFGFVLAGNKDNQ